MNNEYYLVLLAISVCLSLLEGYIVKNRQVNRFILPAIVGSIAIIMGILHSVSMAATLLVFQILALVALYIDDWFRGRNRKGNSQQDRMKIKDL